MLSPSIIRFALDVMGLRLRMVWGCVRSPWLRASLHEPRWGSWFFIRSQLAICEGSGYDLDLLAKKLLPKRLQG